MPASSDQRRRVLLIEDDDADAVLVGRALERFPGFDVRHATDMKSAMALLAAERFDVALLDLSLPDSFGLEGVAALHAQYGELPVVVLTGLADGELALRALEVGAQDYLSKGECSPELLVRTLRYAIQRQQIQGENRRLVSELSRQARSDALTGILNRRSLVVELERQWQRSLRSGQPLACVLLDVDLFKRVNDIHGHSVGDAVLQAVAAAFQQACRICDLPGRYGGEEFLAILPGTTEPEAAAWAERLRRAVACLPIPVGPETLQVTASFGVVQRGPAIADCEELVDAADQALRLAKQLGRDRVVTYEQIIAAADCSSDRGEDAFAQVTAEEIMTPLVATLPDSATLREASRFLLGLRLDSAPIVDEEGRLAGMVGEEDLAQALIAQRDWNQPVREIMRKKPASFASHSSAATIHEFLSRTGSRRVTILDGQRPIGIVSRASMLRWREYHALATRSLLADLAERDDPPVAARSSLHDLVREVGRQAASLEDCLQTSDGPLQHCVVAAATRIQLLLEDAVLVAERMEGCCRDTTTLGAVLG